MLRDCNFKDLKGFNTFHFRKKTYIILNKKKGSVYDPFFVSYCQRGLFSFRLTKHLVNFLQQI